MSRQQQLDEKRARLTPAQRAKLEERLKARYTNSSREESPSVPAITPDPGNRHEPFALTELQQAYWVGRGSGVELGNVACHVYHELEGDQLDVDRLEQAWRHLVLRHDMLRMVVLPDGRQRILPEVPPYGIQVLDLRGLEEHTTATQLEAVRERMSHQVLPSDRWPLFELCVSLLDGGRTRLHMSLDTLIGDAWSFRMLFAELEKLYTNPSSPLPPLELSFRDYVLAELAQRDSEPYQRSLAYWRERLPSLPPAPELPLARSPSELARPRFTRRTGGLSGEQWQRLHSHARAVNLTPTVALLTAYAEVLGRWSDSQRFTLNVPLFNRLPLHPQVNELLGEFASFTLIEVDRTAESTFAARAQRIQQRFWQDMDHSRVSGVHILRELARLRGNGPRATMPIVFTSVLSLEGLGQELPTLGSLGQTVYSITQTPQVWLDLQVFEIGGMLHCQLDAVEELFPPGMVDELAKTLFALLEQLAADPRVWNEPGLDLLPPAQRAPREPRTAPIPDVRVHELFARQVAQRPEQPAVVTPGHTLTYAELAHRAGELTACLREAGIGPGMPVAVVMEKGWEQVVAVLGILGAGAAYLPIDPAVPPARLRALLELGQVRVALTQPWLERLEWPQGLARLRVTGSSPGRGELPRLEGASAVGPEDLAYVLFTSGSTGVPKGAMIGHRGIVNALEATRERFRVGPGDRVFGLTALHHDMSVFDVFGTLAAGGTLVLPEASNLREPSHWAELMQRHRITVWNSVPAFMEMLLEYAEGQPSPRLESLRLAFLGGDWIPLTMPRRLRALAPRVLPVSVGGPTETTLWNIWYPVGEVDPAWPSIPYGRPIPNTRYDVLNEVLEDCPAWVPGELYCAGVGVALGYWADPERTRASFVTHPRTGERLYRTGDRGRYRPDGTIEFLGRVDFQLKLRGQRIEPGEIESVLREQAGIKSALVVARAEAEGAQARQRLVAYVVAEGNPPQAEELRRALERELPAHMVPTAFVFLDALPLSANGKVDRRALPAPSPAVDAPPPSSDTPATPDTFDAEDPAVLERLAKLVQGVLGVAVTPDTNLLQAGANSLDLVRLANQTEKQLGFRPATAELFREPTVRAMARLAAARTPSTSARSGPVERTVDSRLASYTLLGDPNERQAFRARQLALRREPLAAPPVSLPGDAMDDALLARYAARRSHRHYSLKPISLGALGQLLGVLRQVSLQGEPKYLFPSGGGLYPIQLYLHVKAGRVAELPMGTYYYHPVEHHLVPLTPGAELDRNSHVPLVNQPIYDEAALSLFFVSELDAIGPMYGQRSIHISTLDTGIMTQLLDTSAARCGLGLCHIGYLDFDALRPLFALRPSQVLIHSMVGGLPEEQPSREAPAPSGATQTVRAARLLEQIRQLSPEDARALLEAQKNAKGTT